MGKKEAASAPADFPCANAACPVTGRDNVNQRCAGCRAVWYCGRRCQKRHWSSNGGNHRAHCKPAPEEAAAAAAPASASLQTPAMPAATAGEGDADDPAHPCPICLENEDDHGKFAQCFECGRLYCGDCNVAEGIGRVANCPVCRAPFAVPAEVNVERLLRLMARSSALHPPTAQCSLVVMYAKGTGVPQDHAEAAWLLKLAADQGDTDAQRNLAVMYVKGTGVPQDHAEAARLLKLARRPGYADVQFNLAVMYAKGTGVPQDHAEAARPGC